MLKYKLVRVEDERTSAWDIVKKVLIVLAVIASVAAVAIIVCKKLGIKLPFLGCCCDDFDCDCCCDDDCDCDCCCDDDFDCDCCCDCDDLAEIEEVEAAADDAE